MKTHKLLAAISPRDGIAGLLSDNQQSVALIAPSDQDGRIFSTASYLTRFPNTAVVEVADRDEAIEQLADCQRSSLALDFTLLLFDRDVSQETRKEIASELDEILAKRKYRDYVLDITLASPLPDEADLEGATQAVKIQSRTLSLVNTIIGSQERVRLIYSTWLGMRANQLVKQAGIKEVQGALVNAGVFRRLVEEGKTQADVNRIKGKIVLDNKSIKHCDPRIITSFISEYSSTLPSGLSISKESQVSSRENELAGPEELYGTASNLHVRRAGADQQRERAESQVERIADLFGKGSDNIAEQFLKELVESQTSNTNDHRHVVKSLCNIATKCAIRGRHEISMKCLQRACQYSNGIDATLYLTIGNEFLGLKDYDRARKCYNKASSLDHGEKSDAIRLGIIRVSVAKGDYDQALALYHQIPEIHDLPQANFALGTLYRKMGKRRSARESFYKVLNLDSSFHAARAGLAEVAKQTGNHHKAIGQYNAILHDFPDIEEGSRKVYTLARSFLFRLTRQFNKSAALLNQLHSKYPMDCDVHFQLAKLLMLQGETAKAKSHFEKAQGPSLNIVSAQLFSTAIEEPIIESFTLEPQSEVVGIVLPEDMGLATCTRALSAIHGNDFCRAQGELASTNYVDRLQRDFGTVLGYHVIKKLDSTFDYKSDPTICRIAKRGYKELRQSVHAIADGNFEAALKNERQMCLLI